MSTSCDTVVVDCEPYMPPRGFFLFVETGIQCGVKFANNLLPTIVELPRESYAPPMEPLPAVDLSLVPAVCPVLPPPTPRAPVPPATQVLAPPGTCGPLTGIAFRAGTANVEKHVGAIARLFGPREADPLPVPKHVLRKNAVVQLASAFWSSFAANPYPPGHPGYVNWSVCWVRNIFPDVCIHVADVCELFELFRLAADVRDAIVDGPCVDAQERVSALQTIWDRCVYQTPCQCACACSCLHPLTYIVYV